MADQEVDAIFIDEHLLTQISKEEPRCENHTDWLGA